MGATVWAAAINSFGSSVAVVAYSYVAYRLVDSLFGTLAVAVAHAIPTLLLARAAAALAIRLDARRVTFALQLAATALYAGVTILVLADFLSLGLLIASSFVGGTISALGFPSLSTLKRSGCTRDEVAPFTSRVNAAMGVARVIGVLVGGQLLAEVGAAAVFAVDALSSLPMALVALRFARVTSAGRHVRPASSRLRDGIAGILANPRLRATLIATMAIEILAWPLLTLLPKVSHSISPSATTFSLVLAAFYAGSAVVGIAVPVIRTRHGFGFVITVALGLSGGLLIAMALAEVAPVWMQVAVLMVLVFVFGYVVNLGLAITASSIQLDAGNETGPAILAVYGIAVGILGPLGGLVATLLELRLGPWLPLAMMGSGLLIVGLVVGRRGLLAPISEVNSDALHPTSALPGQ